MVCGGIFGWRSDSVYGCNLDGDNVVYQFWVTVIFIIDLVFMTIVSGAYLLYFLS